MYITEIAEVPQYQRKDWQYNNVVRANKTEIKKMHQYDG